ncbi:ALG6, ALG8 glycosyltransferase [Tothia fuscella]|uniref:Alpha-1,3-glucosyltransferase n=1 Tax=Tothia fuscella TaxID=1048955 RepID=A0A9P4NWC9_9PEZI|nr:ALG6, ALG8 glycosyltransferase [Tothia fuscella]
MASINSPHKPRRKRKPNDYTSGSAQGSSTVDTLDDGTKRPNFPLVAFLWPAKGSVSQWLLLPCILMTIGLFRWVTGIWRYSGFQSPPMHGDFEAQRHWLEIAIHLPVSQWYFYDLEWWGLDYPPLTAYHSWILGKIGNAINPSWFELYNSRGLDDHLLKVYMRATVLVSEYVTYIPAIVVFVRRYIQQQGVSSWEGSIALVAILMQPATLLIDHGHFQYNTVMLGFAATCMANFLRGNILMGCISFVCALGFKQMALFYAPAVFAYLLGSCISPKINPVRFMSIALTTTAAFAALFAPLLLGALYDTYRGVPNSKLSEPPLLSALPWDVDSKSWYYPVLLQLTQSIHRIFPFARGIFEDKVANLWCTIHTFHKLHLYSSTVVQRAALAATSAAILPPCLILFHKPRKELLPYGFATVAWAFFLCSYQVHEKNVLLPLLPMTLLLAGHGGLTPSIRAWVGFANILGTWTLFPLLKRDQLRVPYFVLTLFWAYLLGLPPTSLSAYRNVQRGGLGLFAKFVHLSVYLAMILWHICEAFVPPPENKPDLWIVANVLVGAGGFGICYLWCLYMMVLKSGYLGVEMKSKVL